MAERRTRTVTVVEKTQLTPSMVRIVFGGDDLEGFDAGEFTDHYVKLQLPPRVRTYTVQNWDADRNELTIDFVTHGDTGVAGPWATAAEPGDTLELMGPGGAYTPDPEADWHLMVGDSSVIPAIGASLRRIPEGVPVHVLLEVDGPEDEQPLESTGDLHLTYLRADASDPDVLTKALRELDWPAGRAHAFVHGEASVVRSVRKHLLLERELPRAALSCSGYWKRTRTEEGWREDKAEWNRQAEADIESARAA